MDSRETSDRRDRHRTASIDYGRATLFESHRILYERDVPAFENLTALDRLPATGAYVMALPMKIGGGSGAPLRAVAVNAGQVSGRSCPLTCRAFA